MIRLVMTVRFEGDSAASNRVLRDHPDLAELVEAAAVRHNLVRSTRLVGDGVYMDVDEWDREEDRDAFVAELRPHIVRWNELAGVVGMRSQKWRPAAPDEDF